jgi:hypothetical protein
LINSKEGGNKLKKAVVIMVPLLLVAMSAVIPSASASATPVSLLPAPSSYPSVEGPLETEKTIISFMTHYLDGAKKMATGKTDDQVNLRNELDLAMKELNQVLSYLKKGDEENAGKVKMTLLDQFAAIRIAMARCTTLSAEQLEEMEYRVRTSELKLYDLIELEGKEVPLPSTTQPGEKTASEGKGLEYSVKLICGETAGKDGVEPGRYSTVINIRNSSAQSATVKIQAVQAKSLDAANGAISAYQNVDLNPGEAIKVDCATIRKLLELPSATAFIEGFAVINSTAPLDVVGVYTGVGTEGSIFYIQDYSPGTGNIQTESSATSTETASSTEETSTPVEASPTTEPTSPTTESTSSSSDVTTATEGAQEPGTIIIEPVSARNMLGATHTVTIKVIDTTGKPIPGAKVRIVQSGAHTGVIELITDINGMVGFFYIGKNAGTDIIVATVGNLSATAIKEWYTPETQQPTISPPDTSPNPETGPADLSPGTE